MPEVTIDNLNLLIESAKCVAAELLDVANLAQRENISLDVDPRALALCRTKLQEAGMWLTEAVK